MKKQLESVYDIYCIDKQIAALEFQLAELSTSDQYKQKMESAERAAALASKKIAEIEADITDLELKLKSLEAKQAASEKRFYDGSVTNSKELTAIEKDIQQMRQQKATIDSELLLLYDAAAPLKERFNKATNAVKVWKKRYLAADKQESVQKKEIKSQYDKFKKQRSKVVAEITDQELIGRYELILSKLGDTGAAVVVDNRCEACRMAITHNITRALESEETYEMCESCGRILINSKACEE